MRPELTVILTSALAPFGAKGNTFANEQRNTQCNITLGTVHIVFKSIAMTVWRCSILSMLMSHEIKSFFNQMPPSFPKIGKACSLYYTWHAWTDITPLDTSLPSLHRFWALSESCQRQCFWRAKRLLSSKTSLCFINHQRRPIQEHKPLLYS